MQFYCKVDGYQMKRVLSLHAITTQYLPLVEKSILSRYAVMLSVVFGTDIATRTVILKI